MECLSTQNFALTELQRIIRQYWTKNQKLPYGERIRITPDIEMGLMKLTAAEIGRELVQTMLIGGPRVAFKHIFGMVPAWDAKELKIDE